MKKNLIIFHQALSPYKIDLWNSLNELFNFKIFFINKAIKSQNFDQSELEKKLRFKCNYLTRGFNIKHIAIRFGILSVIRKNNPGIIISYEYSPITIWVYFLKRIFGFKYKIYSICMDSLLIAKTCRGFHKLSRDFLVTKIDGLIVVNNDVAKWYNGRFALKNDCIVLGNIYKESDFQDRLKAALPLSNQYLKKFDLIGKRCIFFVGRLVAIKGVDRLLNAFNNIRADYPDVKLVIIGDGTEENKLKNQANQYGLGDAGIFVGRLEGPELDAWYNIGQIFVLPSHYEPFGAVVNEALLGGADVLCSSYAGATSLIQPAKNGEIFDPYDIELLSKLLRTYLDKLSSLVLLESIRASHMVVTFEERINNLYNRLSNT